MREPQVPWSVDRVPDLSGRRALVTGATSGLGAEVAWVLASRGAEVLLAGRHPDRLAAAVQRTLASAPGATVRAVRMDLADLGSVRRAAHEVASHGELHLLVANAGVMATPYRRTVDGFEEQLGTNHLGHFALTGLLMPQLVGSGAGRVVVTSSQLHRLARHAPLDEPRQPRGSYHRWQAYAESKLANLLFVLELERRLHRHQLPVRAVAAHPGLAATDLVRNGHGSTVLQGALSLVSQSAFDGALPLLMAATADLPGGSFVGPDGPGQARGRPVLVSRSRAARDGASATRLWELSEQATGVRYP